MEKKYAEITQIKPRGKYERKEDDKERGKETEKELAQKKTLIAKTFQYHINQTFLDLHSQIKKNKYE